MNVPVDIAGGGAFGTSLAIVLGRAGHPVTLWVRDGADEIATRRENIRRLPGHRLPESVRVTENPADLTADHLLIAVPTQKIAEAIGTLRPRARYRISTAKGISLDTLRGPTSLLAADGVVTAQLTGPSFAHEVAAGLPTALTLATADDADGQMLQAALNTPTIRLYRTSDVIGAELGGALKNVIAIACGASVGAGLGDSCRAALMTRGFAEMQRLATALGANPDTLTGLSGMGDLALTCHSDRSRNFRLGLAIGRGDPLPDGVTVEGAATAGAVARIAIRDGLDLPIVAEVVRLVDGTAGVSEALESLLARPLKPE